RLATAPPGGGSAPGLWLMVSLSQSPQARNGVEAAVEAHDAIHPMLLHDSHMKGIARRQVAIAEHQCFCGLNGGNIDRKDLVDNPVQKIEGRLNRFAPVDGRVPMQNLLKNCGSRDEPVA